MALDASFPSLYENSGLLDLSIATTKASTSSHKLLKLEDKNNYIFIISACRAACTSVAKIVFDTRYTNFLQDFRINYTGYNFNTYVHASINMVLICNNSSWCLKPNTQLQQRLNYFHKHCLHSINYHISTLF